MAQLLHVPAILDVFLFNFRLCIFPIIFSSQALPLTRGPVDFSIFGSPFARPETYVDVGMRHLGTRETNADRATTLLIFVSVVQ
jgi:hypothetical protein